MARYGAALLESRLRGYLMSVSVRAMLHVICAVLVVGVACARAQTN